MIYRIARKISWISPSRRLELYPPFRAMRIKVILLDNDSRDVVIRLPLNSFNRNPGGGMFGGSMASLADPVAALMCSKIFSSYAVWTRHMEIDFIHEGRTDLDLHFTMSVEQEEAIRHDLNKYDRATPVFDYGFYDKHGKLCAKVTNCVAIRPKNYKPGNGALGNQR